MNFVLSDKDCVEGMAELPAKSVQICVTSPPYNIGVKYSRYDDSVRRSEYLAWTKTWAVQLQRVMADDGSFFLNVGASPSNPMLPHEILLVMKDLFVLQNTIHWIKSITLESKSGEFVSSGHFKPINSKRYVTDCHEYIFHLTKTGRVPIHRLAVGVPYADKSNVKRWLHTGGSDRRCRGNNWFIPYSTIQDRNGQRPHPATFPKELPEMCLRLHGACPYSTMLDPFLGIGNSALAALACGLKNFIGFEIDPGYLEVARRLVRGNKNYC